MSIQETIVPMIMRRWDSVNKKLYRYAPWTRASEVDNEQGDNLENTIGDIKGLSASLNATETGYGLDATAAKILNDKFGGLSFGRDENGNFGCIADGSGKLELFGTDTSDATATAEDIAVGKTAYVNGGKVEGNLVKSMDIIDILVQGNGSTAFYGFTQSYTIKSNYDNLMAIINCGESAQWTSSITGCTVSSNNSESIITKIKEKTVNGSGAAAYSAAERTTIYSIKNIKSGDVLTFKGTSSNTNNNGGRTFSITILG